jgi:intracellular septation protein
MQNLLNFVPLLGFLVAYYLGGIYVATAVLMGMMVLVVLIDWLMNRKLSPLLTLSTVLVLVLGTATLILHDTRFLKLKPTIFLWLLGVVFLASQWIGKSSFTQRLLEPAMPAPGTLSAREWQWANFTWVVFYALLGGANLYVAFHASERTWVHFKVIGMPIATMLFAAGHGLWLASRHPAASEA